MFELLKTDPQTKARLGRLTTARGDVTSLLNYTAPSFNYNKQSGSDGADHIECWFLHDAKPPAAAPEGMESVMASLARLGKAGEEAALRTTGAIAARVVPLAKASSSAAGCRPRARRCRSAPTSRFFCTAPTPLPRAWEKNFGRSRCRPRGTP